ncbi:MAG TPA: dipicolinate synthase subunit DpsA [Firmicutes bacterium]|nr:dipicolinate synthase subunit DpsA [Bacillota bacterium]
MNCLRELEIVIIGGDRREIELYRIWNRRGLKVKLLGFELFPRISPTERAGPEDLNRASVLILPLPGLKEDGTVPACFTKEPLKIEMFINRICPQVLILAGAVPASLLPVFAGHGKLVLTAGDQELVVLNSIPTAEGAIQKAMEISEITIHGSRALVLGLGRCGAALARALQGLGAEVTALVRRWESRAVAISFGYKVVFIDRLEDAVAKADFIFNTVPAPLLTAPLLKKANKEAIILDLASSPGGTDFGAAAELELTAVLLPGLPGRVAPKSSGKFLAEVYQRIITCNL